MEAPPPEDYMPAPPDGEGDMEPESPEWTHEDR